MKQLVGLAKRYASRNLIIEKIKSNKSAGPSELLPGGLKAVGDASTKQVK